MEIAIGVLCGVGVTMLFFFLLFALINKRPPKGTEQKLMEHWDTAHQIARRKSAILERTADQLEIANNIAQHKQPKEPRGAEG